MPALKAGSRLKSTVCTTEVIIVKAPAGEVEAKLDVSGLPRAVRRYLARMAIDHVIMMNGMVGLSLLAGGVRHVQQEYNLEGARAYLAVLMPLSVIVLILPNDVQEMAAVEAPERRHGTSFSGVGYSFPEIIPTRPGTSSCA